jgi:hypothetical protein
MTLRTAKEQEQATDKLTTALTGLRTLNLLCLVEHRLASSSAGPCSDSLRNTGAEIQRSHLLLDRWLWTADVGIPHVRLVQMTFFLQLLTDICAHQTAHLSGSGRWAKILFARFLSLVKVAERESCGLHCVRLILDRVALSRFQIIPPVNCAVSGNKRNAEMLTERPQELLKAWSHCRSRHHSCDGGNTVSGWSNEVRQRQLAPA